MCVQHRVLLCLESSNDSSGRREEVTGDSKDLTGPALALYKENKCLLCRCYRRTMGIVLGFSRLAIDRQRLSGVI